MTDASSTRTPIAFARKSRGPSKAASIPAPLTEALREFGRRHELSVETIIRGAWALLLGRYSGERDVAFGVTGKVLADALDLRVAVTPERIALSWLLELRDLEALSPERG